MDPALSLGLSLALALAVLLLGWSKDRRAAGIGWALAVAGVPLSLLGVGFRLSLAHSGRGLGPDLVAGAPIAALLLAALAALTLARDDERRRRR